MNGFDSFPTLQLGSSGAWVIMLQMLLFDIFKNQIYITIDGSFGLETQDAVSVIQGMEDLTVDGIVGPAETWPAVVRLWWEGL